VSAAARGQLMMLSGHIEPLEAASAG
jgi:hypothetical protein